jgi:hypothetical protein
VALLCEDDALEVPPAQQSVLNYQGTAVVTRDVQLLLRRERQHEVGHALTAEMGKPHTSCMVATVLK